MNLKYRYFTNLRWQISDNCHTWLVMTTISVNRSDKPCQSDNHVNLTIVTCDQLVIIWLATSFTSQLSNIRAVNYAYICNNQIKSLKMKKGNDRVVSNKYWCVCPHSDTCYCHSGCGGEGGHRQTASNSKTSFYKHLRFTI